MAAMAFDLAYGVAVPIEIHGRDNYHKNVITERPVEVAIMPVAAGELARLPKPRAADQKYVVDLDGLAWGPRAQIMPHEIGPGELLWDFRPGEQGLETVYWGNGATLDPLSLPALTVMKG
jgi:hypothetical protein